MSHIFYAGGNHKLHEMAHEFELEFAFAFCKSSRSVTIGIGRALVFKEGDEQKTRASELVSSLERL